MKPGVLVVKTPPPWSCLLSANKVLTREYHIVCLDGYPKERYPSAHNITSIYEDHGKGDFAGRIAEIVDRHAIQCAIVLTPLWWYGEEAAKALRSLGVRVLWSEIFPGKRMLFDDLGCQYTSVNQLKIHADRFPPLRPAFPKATRYPQPAWKDPSLLRRKHQEDTNRPIIAVFGQVPADNALRDMTGGVSYYEWLDAIFTENPDTTFLFKQHPAWKTNKALLTMGLDKYPNVTELDESLDSMFMAFDAFAAYSSTVIFEGAVHRKHFATGGQHFLERDGLRLRITSKEEAQGLYSKLMSFKVDEDLRNRWLAFITHAYTMEPGDPRIVERLRLTAEEFFAKTAAQGATERAR